MEPSQPSKQEIGSKNQMYCPVVELSVPLSHWWLSTAMGSPNGEDNGKYENWLEGSLKVYIVHLGI